MLTIFERITLHQCLLFVSLSISIENFRSFSQIAFDRKILSHTENNLLHFARTDFIYYFVYFHGFVKKKRMDRVFLF